MTVDAQVRAVLDQWASAGTPPFEVVGHERARAGYERAPSAEIVHDVARREDRCVEGPDGNEIPVRLYWPAGPGPHPILLFFHGGGWVVGSLDTHDLTCRALTQKARCLTVSVGYRLAPEHPFPAAAEDCWSATAWAAFHAEALGGDRKRLAVAGDSAGGNLAAVVALLCRDRGGPALAHQVLIYPVTDLDADTPSMIENSTGYGLTRDTMVWLYDCYVPNPAERTHPYAAPLRAANLAGLAPATVLVAGHDPLRDEGIAYATRLTEAGVPTRLLRYDGQIHGFFRMTKLLDQAKAAQDEVAAALSAAWS